MSRNIHWLVGISIQGDRKAEQFMLGIWCQISWPSFNFESNKYNTKLIDHWIPGKYANKNDGCVVTILINIVGALCSDG